MPELSLHLLNHIACLDTDKDSTFRRCVGWASSQKRQCIKVIKGENTRNNRSTVQRLLRIDPSKRHLLSVEIIEELGELALLLLCKGNHRAQQDEVHEALIRVVLPHLSNTHPFLESVEIPSTRNHKGRRNSALYQATDIANHPLMFTPHAPVSTPSVTPRDGFTPRNPGIRTKAQANDLARVERGEFNETPEEAGFIYAYRVSHPHFQGLLRIGYTPIKAGNKRGEEIQEEVDRSKKCGRTPILIEDLNQRVVHDVYCCEQLVFAKLAHLRLKEIWCAKCRKSHTKWFEVGEAEALRVIERARQYAEKLHGSAKKNLKRRLPASPSTTDSEDGEATNNPDVLNDDPTLITPISFAQLAAQLGNSYRIISVQKATPSPFPQYAIVESKDSTQPNTATPQPLQVQTSGKRPPFTRIILGLQSY